MARDSLAEQLIKEGKYADLREYQELKTANEMEREAVAKYKEHLKKTHGEAGAEQLMKQKGFDPELVS